MREKLERAFGAGIIAVVGGKRLSIDNRREADVTSAQFGRVSPLVGPVTMDGDDWARAFLAVELKSHVPEAIRDLFDVARGAMLYGWFYYPLFLLGEGQLPRVAEAAVKRCYLALGGPRQRPSFAQAVDWLVDRRVIKQEDRDRWAAVRQLRSDASHPSRASVIPPGHVLRILEATAHDINRLFARAAVAEGG